jgi:putative ABC transport system permease protein
MSGLRRMQATVILLVKRLAAQPGLTLAALVGLVIAVALTMSIPIYADAVYYRTFVSSVSTVPGPDGQPVPQFAFTFRYGLGLNDPLQLEAIAPINAYFDDTAPAVLGLPRKLLVRHYRTEAYPLYPLGATITRDSSEAVDWVNVSSLTGYEAHVTLLEGTLPVLGGTAEDSEMGVLMSAALASALEIGVGDQFFLYLRDRTPDGLIVSTTIPVRIDGIWGPIDPQDSFWVLQPSVYDEHLLIPEEVFVQRIAPYIDDEIYAALWHMVLDGGGVNYSRVPGLLTNINILFQQANTLLPDIRLVTSPRDQLQAYQQSATVLNVLMFAFGLPIVGLILAFIGLTRNLSVEQRRNEIAVLRSRGAMRLQLIGAAALEGLLLGAAGLALALPASLLVAQLIGQTRRFLDFSAPFAARMVYTPLALGAGAAVVIIALLAQVLPTLGASAHTVITYKQERARMQRRPLWQRLWLDVLLFIPAGYGTYLLQTQGTLAVLDRELSRNPFENPLLFLVPALGIFALSLFSLRLLPLLMALIAWIAARTRSTAFVLATRYLARSPGFYNTPLLLLVLTLSLSIFTASLALTFDQHLEDQSYYLVGADVSFSDFGQPPEPGVEVTTAAPQWIFRPVSDYLELPGVEAASRVGIYSATTSLGGSARSAVFLGLDRYDFAQVAYWRSDFAPDSLGALMNELALNPDGVLLPLDVIDRYALQIGDTVRVTVNMFGFSAVVDLRIVGGFKLFATWIPASGPLFVGNLDYLFEQAGAPFPYRVWLRTDDSGAFQPGETYWQQPDKLIADTQQGPERQGLFGLLSVGFIAAAALTVIGFLLYVLFSFRRRFIEMGVLRAVGLSAGQMVGLLAWELIFLILLGGLIGTGLGAWASLWFIPYLQVDTGPTTGIPPVLVQLAWPSVFRIYALFGLLFVLALTALALILRRMRIFQAIKLGETT